MEMVLDALSVIVRQSLGIVSCCRRPTTPWPDAGLLENFLTTRFSPFLLLILTTVTYNGVSNSGITNDAAYIKADLSMWTLSFNLFDMLQVPLCDSSFVADANNQNDCPGDGSFDFELAYKLPSAGGESTSWLASGWQGTGTIQMFAQQDETMLIGDCTLALRTFVTSSSSAQKSLLSTPSAAASVGIASAVAAVIALMCLYCYCCMKKKRQKGKIQVVDEDSSRFVRMEEDKSYWSGAGSKASKKTATTKKSGDAGSAVSDLA